MINNASSFLTPRLPQNIQLSPENSSKKKIKLCLNNKIRNKSTNLPNFQTTFLPSININNNSNKYLDENFSDSRNFKSSFTSTFYTTKSNNQNTIYNNTNKKIIVKNKTLNHQHQLLLLNKSEYF